MAIDLMNATPDRIPPTVITQVSLAHSTVLFTRRKPFIASQTGAYKDLLASVEVKRMDGSGRKRRGGAEKARLR